MERLFALSGLLVMPFWALMIFAPRWRVTARLMRSPAVVLGPVLLYAFLVLPELATILPLVARPRLPEVAALLGQPLGATAAWAHFLAFDLFVARWIFLDARERSLPAWPVSLILLGTLLLGPLGLLGYLSFRAARAAGVGSRVRAVLVRAWQGSPALMMVAAGSLALLGVATVLQLVDGRQVLGASTWLKPAKFAASVALATASIALLLPHLGAVSRGVRRAATLIAVVGAVEFVVVTVQAARGVPSHFNNATTLDMALFQIMGLAITALWVGALYLTIRAFRHGFTERALGWGIRLGLVTFLVGGALGFAMPRPTRAQMESLRAGRPTPLIGAHAVGVPDGGPGLPVTRWSTQGGDLRVPHFVGLHGLQILPLAGWLLGRRRRQGARLTLIAGATYLGLVLVLLAQALRAQPLLAPDAVTAIMALAVLGGGALAAAVVAAAGRRTDAASSPRADHIPGTVRTELHELHELRGGPASAS